MRDRLTEQRMISVFEIIQFIEHGQRRKRKWKKPWKVWEFFGDNIVKLMLFLSLSGVWWNKMITKDKQQVEKEIAINDVVKEKWTEIIESPEESVLTFEEKPYFQNPDFFDKDFKVTRDETYKDKWVILMRDAWMTFYIVQEWEKTKEKIREKLSSIPEFSYLKDSLYIMCQMHPWKNDYISLFH